MGYLPKRKTSMGSKVPNRTVRSLRTVLADRRHADHDVKFKVEAILDPDYTPTPEDDLRPGVILTLRQLIVLGVTRAHLVQPGGSEDWAMLTLSRQSIPNEEWTENDWNVWLHNDRREPWRVGVRIGQDYDR